MLPEPVGGAGERFALGKGRKWLAGPAREIGGGEVPAGAIELPASGEEVGPEHEGVAEKGGALAGGFAEGAGGAAGEEVGGHAVEGDLGEGGEFGVEAEGIVGTLLLAGDAGEPEEGSGSNRRLRRAGERLVRLSRGGGLAAIFEGLGGVEGLGGGGLEGCRSGQPQNGVEGFGGEESRGEAEAHDAGGQETGGEFAFGFGEGLFEGEGGGAGGRLSALILALRPEGAILRDELDAEPDEGGKGRNNHR